MQPPSARNLNVTGANGANLANFNFGPGSFARDVRVSNDTTTPTPLREVPRKRARIDDDDQYISERAKFKLSPNDEIRGPSSTDLQQVVSKLKLELEEKERALNDAMESFVSLEKDWNQMVDENAILHSQNETLRSEVKRNKTDVLLVNRQQLIEGKINLERQVRDLESQLTKNEVHLEEFSMMRLEYEKSVELIADLQNSNRKLHSDAKELQHLRAALEAASIKERALEIVAKETSAKLTKSEKDNHCLLIENSEKSAELNKLQAKFTELSDSYDQRVCDLRKSEKEVVDLKLSNHKDSGLQSTISQQNNMMRDLQSIISKQDWSTFLENLNTIYHKCLDSMNLDSVDLSLKLNLITEKIGEISSSVNTIVPIPKVQQPELWPDAVIRYYIEPSLEFRVAEVLQAIQEVETCTHVKLIRLPQPPVMAAYVSIGAGTFSCKKIGSTSILGYPGPTGISKVIVDTRLNSHSFSLTIKHEIGYHVILGTCHYHQTLTGARLLEIKAFNEPHDYTENKYSAFMEQIVQDIGYFPCFSIGCYANDPEKLMHHSSCPYGDMMNQSFGSLDGVVISSIYKKQIFKREFDLQRMREGSCQWAADMCLQQS